MKYKKDTSNIILNAAFKEFEEKGYNGARMQSIANRAGINKALLHYYYKNKDALFQIIIRQAFKLLLPKIVTILEEDIDLFTSIEKFTSAYIDTLIRHPHIPSFVSQEVNNNPERIPKFIKSIGLNTTIIKQKISIAIEEGLIEEIDPEQLIVNIVALCVFPFIAKPLITEIVLEGDQHSFIQMIEARKKDVSKFIIKAIKK